MDEARKKDLLEGRFRTPVSPTSARASSYLAKWLSSWEGGEDVLEEARFQLVRFEEEVYLENYSEAFDHYIKAIANLDIRHLVELFPTEKYQPLEILGAGGFGVAFLCREITGNQVVVKALLGGDDNTRQAMIHEAAALQQSRSPYVISICGYGYANWKEKHGGPFIATEFIDGENLESYLQKNGPLSLEKGLELAKALSRGMIHAHGAQVIHRDLKPENILYSVDDQRVEVRILDFGLARQEGIESLSRSLKNGTLPYASPEQLGQVEGEVAATSDVYSFGMTLIRTFTGSFNFSDLLSLPHRGLRDLIFQCISFEPSRRPADFKEVLSRLEKIEKNPASDFTEPPGGEDGEKKLFTVDWDYLQQIWDRTKNYAQEKGRQAQPRLIWIKDRMVAGGKRVGEFFQELTKPPTPPAKEAEAKPAEEAPEKSAEATLDEALDKLPPEQAAAIRQMLEQQAAPKRRSLIVRGVQAVLGAGFWLVTRALRLVRKLGRGISRILFGKGE